MKKLKVSYTLTYKITDYELFEELDSNESAWVEFLTYVLDSVRFSEDFTKKWVSTEGDELYWDDEEDYGIAEVLVTIEDNFDGNLEWWNELLPTLKETWDIPIKTTLMNLMLMILQQQSLRVVLSGTLLNGVQQSKLTMIQMVVCLSMTMMPEKCTLVKSIMLMVV
jgi:hypothetical protein